MKSLTARKEFAKSKLVMSLDYIFGKGTGKKIDFEKVDFKYSRRTGRLKYVIEKSTEKILFTFRSNGTIAPTIIGAEMLISGRNISRIKSRPRWTITVLDGVSDFISNGRTVFCKHVVSCSDFLRPGEDVAVLNESGRLLAMGRSMLAGAVLKQFKRGAAVKIREGAQ
ncbi:MAG: PUA domain-containing protein [Nitrososphaerales archaeon]